MESNAAGSLTNVELMDRLGRIYGFEVRSGNGARGNNYTKVHFPASPENERVVIKPNQEEEKMAEKKLCKNGCGKQALKEGLCFRCFHKETGHVPFGRDARKAAGGGLACYA